jgi:hypothetical protein
MAERGEKAGRTNRGQRAAGTGIGARSFTPIDHVWIARDWED